MAAAALVSGCGSMSTTARDMSTGEETALIEGVNQLLTNCTIHGPFPVVPGGVRPKSSFSKRHSLVADAGPLKIMVSCTTDYPFSDSIKRNIRINFVSEAGHTYTIAQKKDCMELVDATVGRVVACEPYYRGHFAIQSTGDDIATFITVGDLYSDDFCRVDKEGVGRKFGHLEVDAGPITVNAICEKKGAWSNTKRTSSFDFVAEAGHTYTITATDKECMSLIDITSEEIVIACESYEKSK